VRNEPQRLGRGSIGPSCEQPPGAATFLRFGGTRAGRQRVRRPSGPDLLTPLGFGGRSEEGSGRNFPNRRVDRFLGNQG